MLDARAEQVVWPIVKEVGAFCRLEYEDLRPTVSGRVAP